MKAPPCLFLGRVLEASRMSGLNNTHKFVVHPVIFPLAHSEIQRHNKFLACALDAEADYIITGDNHLLEIKHFQKIQIVDANAFVKKFKNN